MGIDAVLRAALIKPGFGARRILGRRHPQQRQIIAALEMRAFLGTLLSALEIDQRGSRIGKRADRITQPRSPYRLDPDCPARSQPPPPILHAGGAGNPPGGGSRLGLRPAHAPPPLEPPPPLDPPPRPHPPAPPPN